MRLAWTRSAHSADRKSIREYIARDNPAAALAMDERLPQTSASLTDYPNLGRLGRVAGTREAVVHENCVLVYNVVGDCVRVLRILHVDRQWPPNR